MPSPSSRLASVAPNPASVVSAPLACPVRVPAVGTVSIGLGTFSGMEDLILLLEDSSLKIQKGEESETIAAWAIFTRLTEFQRSDRRWRTRPRDHKKWSATSPSSPRVRRRRGHADDP